MEASRPKWSDDTLIQQERTLLMALFNWPEEILDISLNFINSEDFFIHLHGKVFDAMRHLAFQDETVSWDTLPGAMISVGLTEDAIEKVMDEFDDDYPGATWDSIRWCASQIAEMSRRRRMAMAIAELYKTAVEGELEAGELLKALEKVNVKCGEIAKEECAMDQ